MSAQGLARLADPERPRAPTPRATLSDALLHCKLHEPVPSDALAPCEAKTRPMRSAHALAIVPAVVAAGHSWSPHQKLREPGPVSWARIRAQVLLHMIYIMLSILYYTIYYTNYTKQYILYVSLKLAQQSAPCHRVSHTLVSDSVIVTALSL